MHSACSRVSIISHAIITLLLRLDIDVIDRQPWQQWSFHRNAQEIFHRLDERTRSLSDSLDKRSDEYLPCTRLATNNLSATLSVHFYQQLLSASVGAASASFVANKPLLTPSMLQMSFSGRTISTLFCLTWAEPEGWDGGILIFE